MQSDLPHTLYLSDRKKGRKRATKKEEFKYNPEDPAIRKQREAIRKAKERQEADGEKVEYTMEEIFDR